MLRLSFLLIIFLTLSACSHFAPREHIQEHPPKVAEMAAPKAAHREATKPIRLSAEKPNIEHPSQEPKDPVNAEDVAHRPPLIQAAPTLPQPLERKYVLMHPTPDADTPSATPSLKRYLDSFFDLEGAPAHVNSQKGRDFSSYGFITPTDSLEELVNEELASLRPRGVPSGTKNLLDRMRKGFSLDLSSTNPRFKQQFRWYASNPDYLDRTFSRASRYLHHIVEELEKADMPLELALLPLVESAYDPFAYSHGRASGLWQFIPGTGKIYGLHQTWWYDGRRDILASTQAAIQYLQYLHRRFDGDWLHALAAYNSGSGRVSGAIRKNKKAGKPTDFWSLKLPRETRAYVPKLLAIAKLVADPEKYGIQLNPIPDKPYFDVVNIDGQMDLAHAAELANIEIEELYRLNPGFNQWATDPHGPHRLLIPADKSEQFAKAVSELDPRQRITWQRYKVKSGDSLIKIAKRFQTTPDLIRQVNKLNSHLIRVNQKLLIPVASQKNQYYGLSESNRLAKKQSRYRGIQGGSKLVHHVRAGDTLWDLARAHKVSTRAIAKWNGRAPGDVLKPGEKLVIWSQAELDTSQSARLPSIDNRQMIKRIGYRVRKGDSLARIASKFSVSIKDLVSWNKLDRRKYLQPGQKLTIYVDITNS